jgi:hypothetical protein
LLLHKKPTYVKIGLLLNNLKNMSNKKNILSLIPHKCDHKNECEHSCRYNCMYSEGEEGKKKYCINNTKEGGRGLCLNHYIQARYWVKKEKETWESLEKEGLCRKFLTQKEKNINQMHQHRNYKKRRN